jgi:hypothetical protein
MLLGIYAPVIYNEEEDEEEEQFWLIVFVSAKPDVEEVSLEIDLMVKHPDTEAKTHSFKRTYPKGSNRPDAPWGFVIPLPVVEAMKFGSFLECTARANGVEQQAWLTMVNDTEDQEEESVEPSEQG